MFINVVIISYHNNNKNIFFIYLLNVCVCHYQLPWQHQPERFV